MKLHLPAFLRKAVLACLAALAMPLTVGSGAAFLASGALVSFALSQRVMAETLNHDDGVTYSGDIFSLDASGNISLSWAAAPWVYRYYWDEEQQSMVSDSTQVSFGATFAPRSGQEWENIPGHTLRLYGATGDKQIGVQASNGNFWLGGLIVEDSGVAGGITYWFSRTSMDPGMTYSFGAQEGQAVNMTLRESVEFGAKNYNVYSDGTWTIRGDRTLTFGTRNSNAGSRQFIVYAGNALTFDKLPDGDSESGDASVVFSGHEVVLQSESSITVSHGVSVTMGSGVSATGGTMIVNGSLQLGATSSIGTLACGNWGYQGSILFGDSTGRLTVGSGDLTQLHLAEGATLEVTSGLLRVTYLDVQNSATQATGGEANLVVNVAGGATIGIFDIFGDSRLRVSITQADVLAIVENGGEYQLFDARYWEADPTVGYAHKIDFDEMVVGRTTVSLDKATGKLIAEGEAAHLTWDDSQSTWANGEDGAEWTTSATDRHFYENDHVSFNGTGSVTISGTVAPGSMTVNGAYTFSGGTLSVTDSIQVTGGSATFADTVITSNGLVISGGATVVLNAVTDKTFGGITVGTGSTLKLTARSAGPEWLGGNVSGEGTLELASGAVWSAAGNDPNGMLWRLVSQTAGETIGELKVVESTILDSQEGGNNNYRTVWQNIKKITVESGSHWGVSSSNFTEHESWTLDHEYHIAGTGTGDAVSGATTAENSSALSFDDKFGNNTARNYYLSGDLYLDAAAAVLVGGQNGTGNAAVATVRGTFHAGTNALTKLGAGTLVLTTIDGGTNAGDITISAGTLKLAFAAENADKIANKVTVSGTLDIVGAYTYTIDRLVGGGSIISTGDAGATLRILAVSESEYAATASIADSITIVMDGASTNDRQILNGSFNGNVEVKGGSLTFNSAEARSLGSVKLESGALLNFLSGNNSINELSCSSGDKAGSGTVVVSGGRLTVGQGVLKSLQFVGDGSSLAVTSGLFDLGSLTVNGSSATLAMNVGGGAQLSLGSLAGQLTLVLLDEDLSFLVGDTEGYQLFTTWNEDLTGKIHFDEVVIGRTTVILDTATGRLIATGGAADLTWNSSADNALTWATGAAWGDNEQFYEGDNVSFTGEGTVTISGTVAPGNMTVSGGGTTVFTGGNLSVGGTLTVSDTDTVAEIAVAQTGVTHSFGDVVINEGATLRFKATGIERITSGTGVDSTFGVTVAEGAHIHGAGALEYHLGVTGGFGRVRLSTLLNVLSAESNGSTPNLAALYLSGSTVVYMSENNNAELRKHLVGIKDVYVTSGASLSFNGNAFQYDETSPRPSGYRNTLHIAGNGAQSGFNGVLATESTSHVDWDIMLEANATVGCNASPTLTWTGRLTTNGNTLTFAGAGKKIWSGTFTTSAETTKGLIDVTDGAVQLEYVDGSALSGYNVTLTNPSGSNRIATLTLGSGAEVYSIGGLAGNGAVNLVSGVASSTLDIHYNAVATAADGVSFSGTISDAITVRKTGTGTQTLTGAFAGAVDVQAGKLALGGTTVRELTSVDVAADAELTVSKGLTVSGAVTLGGKLTLSEGTLQAASLEVQEGGGTIELQLVEGVTLLDIAGDITGERGLSIVVLSGTVGTYQLFDRENLPNIFSIENIDTSAVLGNGRELSYEYRELTGELVISANEFDLRWSGGDVNWGTGQENVLWENASEGHRGESQFFVQGDSVIFDGTGVEGDVAVTVSTEVAPHNVTIHTDADTGYSFSGEAIAATGSLTVDGGGKAVFNGAVSAAEGANVEGNSTLELTGSGAGKALGSITVEAGSEVVVSTREGWSASSQNYVSGGGTLVYQGILTPFSDSANVGKGLALAQSTLNGENTISELILRGSDYALYTSGQSMLRAAVKITVESGSSFGYGAGQLTGNGHTLTLNGEGMNGKGALYTDAANLNIGWDVALGSATTISANHSGFTLNGTLHANRNTLTKAGTGLLKITKVDGGANAGNMVVSEGTLNLALAAAYAEAVANNVEVKADATLSLSGAYSYTIATLSGEGTVTGDDAASLVIDNDSIRGAEFTGAVSGLARLTKKGGGKQTLHSIGAAELVVEQGELIYAGGESGFVVDAATVSGATLTLATELSAANSALTLAGGATLKLTGGDVELGALTSSGTKSNSISRAGDAGALRVSSLSGAANLSIGALAEGASLSIGEVSGFTGKLSGTVSGSATVSVGNVVMDSGEGSIIIEGGVHVNDSMTKSGAGSFSINHLIVDNGSELNMNYAGGALSITTLQVANGGVLRYSGSAEHVIESNLSDLLKTEGNILLDIWDVEAARLDSGICLGIRKGESEVELAELTKLFSINTAEVNGEFELSWGANDMLYLSVTQYTTGKSPWDAHWGVGEVKYAPSLAALEASAAVFSANDKAGLDTTNADTPDFTHIYLALGENSGRYMNGGAYYVLLTEGPSQPNTLASVFGGEVYGVGAEPGRHADGASFIYLRPDAGTSVYYHLLVGGSSCVSTTAADDAGFFGNSHIQVEGGTVDYIVGGNHVTNAAFTFKGNSYISVYEGSTVRGGIVGGSTLTLGASGDEAYEFDGNSHIYIYTVLSGDRSGAKAISDATHSASGADRGVAFAAVVGGNAWIDLPTDDAEGTAPSFHGSSRVVVELDASAEGQFDKAIVGGNYTAPFDGGADAERSTLFVGTAQVRVAAGEGVVFTGGISGASRRDSAGSGSTLFTGSTLVEIAGGMHQQAIAGGFWFDENAAGERKSVLTGNTEVAITSGYVWRAVGGSYSLGGGDTALDTHEGSSKVSISGGVVNSSVHFGDAGQKAMAFVAGGNFYRNNSGSHVRNDGSTLVEISGSAELGFAEDGIHIVGGDYANFSAGSGAESVINGNTGVSMSGGSVHGLVVGGSYLTDEGSGGSVTINGTSSVTVSGGSVTADSLTSAAHDHYGVALVGGSMIVDNGSASGSHVAAVENTAVSVTGGVVDGHIVGGSFSNESDGVNTLSLTGTASVTVSGGVVYGNIYGGHFSANVLNPDKLELAGACVTLEGEAQVKGNIIGGSYRLATEAISEAPRQGEIVVKLAGGTLDGHVYAAGWNNSPLSSALSVTTESTRVELSSEIEFTAISGPGESANGEVIVSGGYYKGASTADLSTVTGASELVFTDAGATYANIDRVTFVDFNTVSVASGSDIALAAGRFYARDNVSFTKLGAGSLTLAELKYRNAAGAVRPFAGKIAVMGGGSLILQSDQSVNGGLAFDLAQGLNSLETAYLQAKDGAHLVTGGSLSIAVELSAGENGSALRVGTYYLASGFEGVDAELFEITGLDTEAYVMQLEMTDDDCLVLRVHRNSPNSWIWDGSGNGVWNGSSENWTYEGEESCDGQNVYFETGAESETVAIEGTVTPGNVYVVGGDYTFTQSAGSGGGLNIAGELSVGNKLGESVEPATLRLELANTSVPRVVLEDTGTLVLAHEGALNGVQEIAFDGGVLSYAVENGKLLNSKDLSAKVAQGEGALRIQVGSESAETDSTTLTWGSASAAAASNEGLRRILTDGIEKSGNAVFAVEWAATAGEQVKGTANVTAGTLAYAVHAQAGSEVSMTGSVAVAKGATASISASGGSLAISSELSGEGTVVIGAGKGSADYKLSGDNSGFDGTLELSAESAGQSVLVQDTRALGGANTTLALSGRSVVLGAAAEAEIAAGAVSVAGVNYLGGTAPKGVNASITLAGDVVDAEGGAAGVLAAAAGANHTIQGSVAGYSGTLLAESQESVWTLGNAKSAPVADGAVIDTKLAGKGQVTIAYQVGDDAETEGTLTLGGAISDSVDVENATNATIVLTGESRSTGKLIATGAAAADEPMALAADAEPAAAGVGGSFRLGTAAERGVWAGSVIEGGADKSFTLVNGSLTNGITTKGDVQLKVDTTEASGLLVEAGGTRGSLFDSIALSANSRLSGVAGDITAAAEGTQVSLQLGASNIDSAKGADSSYLLGSDGGNLVLAASSALSMDFSNDGFIDLLKKHRAENAKSYAHVLSGGGQILFSDPQAEGDLYAIFNKGSYAELLDGLSFLYKGVDGGDIIITGSSSEVYLVLDANDNKSDPHTVSAYGVLDSYLATVLDEGETLTISVGDDTRTNADGTPKTQNSLTVNNLVGLEGSTLNLRRSKDATKDVTVNLNNANVKVSDEFGLPEGVTPESLSSIDTEFEGSIVSEDAHVHVNKVGPGTLTVGSKSGESGGLSLAGDLRLSGGRVTLRGKESSLSKLVFSYDTAADSKLEEERGLVVRGGVATLSSISEQGAYVESNSIILQQGGELALSGASVLEHTSISAENGGGVLSVSGKGGRLELGGESTLDGADVELSSGGQLALSGDARLAANSMSIDAASALTVGGTVAHTVGTLSSAGTLRGDSGSLTLTGGEPSVITGRLEGKATLSVAEGSSLTLKGVEMDTAAGRWSVTNSGSLTIDVAESRSDVRLGSLTLKDGSQTRYSYNTDHVGSTHLVDLDSLYIERGAKLTIASAGRQAIQDTHLQLGRVAQNTGSLTTVELEGVAFQHYKGSLRWNNGELYLDLTLSNENIFLRPNMEKNAQAGAQLFWDASGPDGAWQSGVLEDENSQLSEMLNALEQMSKSGSPMLDRTLAAGAGASVAALGSALTQDLQRQLSAIRTRTTALGSDVAPESGRNYSLWFNGEASYHKLNEDGLAPGYTLNGWGGTVGMNVDLAPGAMVGVAVSAMYNDLKTSSADNGRGDLDTTYLSIFGRKAHGAWMHTLVLSGGVADVTLNRSVNHVTGGYNTTGSTDGYALGLLYEVGYSKVMNSSGSFILQPVFNIELRHAAVSGYTETGSDAGLRVDDISQDVVTFGLGARMQRIVGENAYNRASVLEARFLLKADAGDTRGKADNALINGAARTARVESAEVGPVGIEIGAGLNIPVGAQRGTLFMDASVELRKDYTAVDANVGYRVNF